jgi:hypothetical protein
MEMERMQRPVLAAGLLVAMILLGRFAIDFSLEMPLLLSVPFVLLVLCALAVAAWNISRLLQTPEASRPPIDRATRVALLAFIPLGFWAASLDCSGLSWQGCTPFCTFIKIVWIPALAVLALLTVFIERDGLLLLINVMAFVPLWPHCQCFNPGNGWWIERLGASPMCYVWGFVVALIAVSAIKSRAQIWVSLLIGGAILSGAFGFFIAHHYFHFPW